jgi:hypothetical protein
MKLFIVHVGFYDQDIGIYELHSNLLVVASDARDAKEIVKNKPVFINKKMHIDAIQEIQNVDGYDIKLEAKSAADANLTLDFSAVNSL